jgi:hypothetical protein
MRLASAATIADATTRAAHGRSRAEALLVLAALLVFIVPGLDRRASGGRENRSDQYWCALGGYVTAQLAFLVGENGAGLRCSRQELRTRPAPALDAARLCFTRVTYPGYHT